MPGVKRATSSDAAGNHHSLARLDRFPVIIEVCAAVRAIPMPIITALPSMLKVAPY